MGSLWPIEPRCGSSVRELTTSRKPGVFQEQAAAATRLREGSEKGVGVEEIEKDVTRTMPLNVFFGGDGQRVDKLRAVLGAYSL